MLGIGLVGTLTTRAASPLPEPIPGWRVEVVLEAPQLKHPSVVATAPDGRVFVAEDPMDISTPKADATEGRILCLHPDGKVTVFAERLYAVFGLQYLEGKLYVLHNPKFSVFDDDNGVGRNRRELIAQTLPDPSALNWNDHVPANFRLGMDGYFYVASGDKGLFGAQGTDGSRATLSTGGIFRIRPDGTKLEVVAHGVRNILDVALNSEDEQFTYDNTDEHDWMGRFTHMVEAGFYGYPHDFIPQRPYTLWMMADYGAGAACGVFANTEDALPPEYRDNVFLSDFGKRQIMRVRVEREGGTYRAVSKEDLFPNPPGDFRPVGITPSADGKGLYICDWQHRDEKAEVTVGRLLKLTWTGTDHTTPKPPWYVPAASGKPFTATTAELVAGLSHPSRNVRLTAERRLADRKANRELLAVLRDRSASALARSHALWALAADNKATKETLAATKDPEPIVRRQALRHLGARRSGPSVTAARDALAAPDASVRFQAASALGRLGDPDAVPPLLNALDDPDLFARYAAFTALNRIGTNTPRAWPLIVRGLESKSPRTREGTAFALRDTCDPTLLAALNKLFRDTAKPADARRAALELIAAQHHRLPAWNGHWWAYHPALQPPPAKTVKWEGTDSVLATLRAGLQEPDAGLRRAAIDALAAALDTNSAPVLRDAFTRESDPAGRAAILRALGAMKDSAALPLVVAELETLRDAAITAAAIAAAEALGGTEATQALAGLLRSPKATGSELARTIGALGNLAATNSTAAIEPLIRNPDAAVRAAVFSALGQLQGEAAVPMLEVGLADGAAEVGRAVVKALGNLKSRQAVPALLKAYANPSLRNDAFFALTRTPDERALDAFLDGLASKNPTERNAAHLAVRDVSSKVLPTVTAKAGSLPSQALTELRQIYAGNPQAEAGPIFTREIRQHTPEEYLSASIERAGDAARGQRLFADAGGINCVACHRVAGRGSDTGPDLSGVGTQFDRRALAEAILYPSKTVREGYQQIQIALADDEEISGVVKAESADILTLRDAAGAEHRIPKAKIKSRSNSALSLMPEGLQAALSLDEFTDLIAYLAALKGQPLPAAAK